MIVRDKSYNRDNTTFWACHGMVLRHHCTPPYDKLIG